MNSNKEEILKKATGVFALRVLGYGFGFLFTWLIANKYGAKIQGVFSIAFLFLSVGAMIAKLGVETALVKWIASSIHIGEKKDIYFKSIKLIVVSSVSIGLLVYSLAPLIALMYNKPDIESSIKIAALAIPFLSLLDISGSFFKGEKRTNTFGVYFHLAKFLAPFLIILAFYLLSLNFIEVPIVSYLIGLFIVSSIIIIHILSLLKGNEKTVQPTFSFKFMVLESYPMMVSSAIVMIMGWSDVFILGFYVSEEQIGVYSVAIKLATLVSFVYNAIATIATPKIANFYHSNQKEKLNETIAFSAKVMVLCGVPVFLTLFAFPEVILNFFGETYKEGKSVLRILLLAQLTNVLTGMVGPIFQMTGKQKKLQHFIMLSLVFNIIFSLLLVQFFEMEGVATASALGMMLWNILGAFYIYKKMNISTWLSF